MSATLRRSLCLGAALLLAACGGTGGDNAALDLPVQLTSGAAVIAEAPAVDAYSVANGIFPPGIGIIDAVRAGNTIAVLLVYSANGATAWHDVPVDCSNCTGTLSGTGATSWFKLLLSLDLGATWTLRDLPWPSRIGEPLGIMAVQQGAKTRAYLAGTFAGLENYGALAELDLARLAYIPNAELDANVTFGARVMQRGPNAVSYYWAGGTGGAVDYTSYDLTQTMTPPRYRQVERPYTPSVCSSDYYWATDDGRAFTSLCSTATQVCVSRATPGAVSQPVLTPATICAAKSLYPTAIARAGQLVPTAVGQPLGLVADPYQDPSHILGTWIDASSGKPVVLDLGPGKNVYLDSHVHEPGGPYLRLGLPGSARWVSIPASGPAQEVLVPAAPCGGLPCGREAAPWWILSLGNGQSLVLYLVDARKDPLAVHQSVVAYRTTLATGPIGSPPPP